MAWGSSLWDIATWGLTGSAWGDQPWEDGTWGGSGGGGPTPDVGLESIASLRSALAAYSFGPATPPKPWAADSGSIAGSISAISYYDFSASVGAVEGVSLQASIEAVVGNLSASIFSVTASVLQASAGGHLPENFAASIGAIDAESITAYVRAVLSGVPEDVSSTITSTGYFEAFAASIQSTGPGYSDMQASIFAWLQKDMPASISGWETLGISASISHNYAAPGLRALIKPFKSAHADMGVFLRPAGTSTSSIPTYIRPVISAHTGPKQRNIGSWGRPFLSNRLLVATRGGLSFLTPEAVFSYSPDLAASIYGDPLAVVNFNAFIRAYSASSSVLQAGISGVTPKVYVNKVLLNYVLFKSLKAYITKVGEFSGLRTSIKPLQRASTGTAIDAGFNYTYETSGEIVYGYGGFVVLPRTAASVKKSTYKNRHPSPDLHAFLDAWATQSLTASIKSYPSSALAAAITALDLSRISSLRAHIQSQTPANLNASVASVGEFTGFGASAYAAGSVAALPAKISGYPEILGREFVAVHTKPFSGMAAYINYDQTFSCSVGSMVVPLSARISTWFSGDADMSVSIQALRGEAQLSAAVFGRKRVMLKMMGVYFRTSSPLSAALPAHITGWARAVTSDFGASIVGLSHEADLSAEISGVRLRTSSVITSKDVLLVDVHRPSNRITAELLFASGVSSYIYDAVRGSVYRVDTSEEWAVLVREQRFNSEFFDRPADLKTAQLSVISDYDSFDEAIRAALDTFLSSPYSEFGASITVAGAASSLVASVYSDSLDKVANMVAGIYPVLSMPDIQASIASSGSLASFFASVKSLESSSSSLSVSLAGWCTEEMSAELVAVP